MSSILLTHAHALPPAEARVALSSLAESLARKLALEIRREGEDVLHIHRSGVDGTIRLQPGLVEVLATLGTFLSPMKSMVEQEVRRVLEEKFR